MSNVECWKRCALSYIIINESADAALNIHEVSCSHAAKRANEAQINRIWSA